MSARIYRMALYLLPAPLRQKHGASMELLFVREVERAREHGHFRGTIAAVAGVWDVIQRGSYELTRSAITPEHDSHEPFGIDASRHQSAGVNFGASHMNAGNMNGAAVQLPTTRQLLGRLAVSFAVAFVVLTSFMLYVFASRQGSLISAGNMVQILLLALPFTAAMTIPMSVFLAVIYQFTRLGANGTLDAARRVRDGVRRLVLPVLIASIGMVSVSFVVTAQIVPRTNEQLSVALRGESGRVHNERTMTISQLREAARSIEASTEALELARANGLEVEVQKKIALPVACLLLAFAGMALAFRMPRGGMLLVLVSSLACFASYYVLIMGGEALADEGVVSPFVGMWGANAFVLSVALLAMWQRRSARLVPARD